MTTLYVILLLAGAICLALAAVGLAVRVNLLALGLLLWITVPLIEYGRALG